MQGGELNVEVAPYVAAIAVRGRQGYAVVGLGQLSGRRFSSTWIPTHFPPPHTRRMPTCGPGTLPCRSGMPTSGKATAHVREGPWVVGAADGWWARLLRPGVCLRAGCDDAPRSTRAHPPCTRPTPPPTQADYCHPTAYHIWIFLLNRLMAQSLVGNRVSTYEASGTGLGSTSASHTPEWHDPP